MATLQIKGAYTEAIVAGTGSDLPASPWPVPNSWIGIAAGGRPGAAAYRELTRGDGPTKRQSRSTVMATRFKAIGHSQGERVVPH